MTVSAASACIIHRTHHILHLVPSAPGFLPHTSNAVKKTSFRQICTVANTATDCFTGIKSGRYECRSEKLQRITVPKVGRFLGFGRRPKLPDLCHAGDPVLHEEADEVPLEELGSQRIQNIIDDMIAVMRNAPAVGLAAPQIGIPLQIIVLEDTKEYISYAPKEEAREQERYPFELLTLVNPKLKAKGTKTARFFEGCLSVDGYRGLVERYLHVQVTGFARNGDPIVVDASGWKARILQHECDHLAGFLYVDKLIPRTFRTVGNLQMPLAAACPRPGVI